MFRSVHVDFYMKANNSRYSWRHKLLLLSVTFGANGPSCIKIPVLQLYYNYHKREIRRQWCNTIPVSFICLSARLSGQIEKQLLHTKQCFFKQVDKAGKPLAYQIRTEAASRLIPRIRLASDDTTSNSTAINNAFVDYYSKLYSSETSLFDWDGPNPLDLLMYPQIDPVVATELGAPVMI